MRDVYKNAHERALMQVYRNGVKAGIWMVGGPALALMIVLLIVIWRLA
jgi:hypothetical protein